MYLGVGTKDYIVRPDDTDPWTEYHVDFLPDMLKGGLNGGIGGYVSQRRTCHRLRPCAPRTDAQLKPFLCDLLVTSSPQLHERLHHDVLSLVIGVAVRKEFFHNGASLGYFEGRVIKMFDDAFTYRVKYDDGDVEDYSLEELLPLLQVNADRRLQIETAHSNFMDVLKESKKTDCDERFFAAKLVTKELEWFGRTLEDRRRLSCSLMNFCVFRHPVGSCKCDEGVDPWRAASADKPCVFRHDPSVCKCDQIAIQLSQDECSYAAYMLSKREWRCQGTHQLRKKAPGLPLMVSGYSTFEFGAGFMISQPTLDEVNRFRAEGPEHYSEETQEGIKVKKKPLTYYPCSDDITVVAMIPGANKDGWWTLPKILHQAEDVIDVLRVIAPPRLYQYIPFYDNSATHNKRESLTLSVSNLGAKWGGKKRGLRDSRLVEGCVGPNSAVLWYFDGKGTGEWEGGPEWLEEEKPGASMRVCTLKVGDVDYGRFKDGDPPPFYDLGAQRYDRPMNAAEKFAERQRYLTFIHDTHTRAVTVTVTVTLTLTHAVRLTLTLQTCVHKHTTS